MSRPDAAHADAALTQLRRRVDDHVAAVTRAHRDDLRCAPGCASCCQRSLGVFVIEAARVAEAILALDPSTRARLRARAADALPHCALLLEDRCAIYEERPLLCRSHGVPLLADEGDEAYIDVCSLNFTETDPQTAPLLRLSAVDAPLSLAAELFVPGAQRIALDALAWADDEDLLRLADLRRRA